MTLFFDKVFAKEIEFDASNIEIIKNQNLTIANNGIAKIKEDGIIIEGEKIKHFKEKSEFADMILGVALKSPWNTQG